MCKACHSQYLIVCSSISKSFCISKPKLQTFFESCVLFVNNGQVLHLHKCFLLAEKTMYHFPLCDEEIVFEARDETQGGGCSCIQRRRKELLASSHLIPLPLHPARNQANMKSRFLQRHVYLSLSQNIQLQITHS